MKERRSCAAALNSRWPQRKQPPPVPTSRERRRFAWHRTRDASLPRGQLAKRGRKLLRQFNFIFGGAPAEQSDNWRKWRDPSRGRNSDDPLRLELGEGTSPD